MFDVVYVLGKGSNWKNNEIRYSLRSLQKHVAFGNVFIVGDLPLFLTGVIHLPCDDPFKWNKEANIMHKILVACRCSAVSREFLFVNDDHFFLRRIGSIPYVHMGPLSMGDAKSKVYAQFLENTRRVLAKMKLETNNFDTHLPIMYDKSKFLEMEVAFNWQTDEVEETLVVKSLYCNYHRIIGVHDVDVKLEPTATKDQIALLLDRRWAFSVSDEISPDVKKMLQRLYPEPSTFEKDLQ